MIEGPQGWRSMLRAAAAALVAVGLVARIAPLLDRGGRLLQQFPTEDGYLMLTIARNLALGHGMSTAEGTLPTNGTQPLATLLFAACFWLVDGDKKAGVALVLGVELLLACAGAWLLYRLGRRVFAARPFGGEAAALAAGLWFASPISVAHSMNCLETGLYALGVILVLHLLVRGRRPGGPVPSLRAWAGLGALLGLAFWARNDAVLLCGVLAAAHLAGALAGWPGPFRARFAELAVAGTVTGLVATPWLVHNQLRFGSVVPISGQAESLAAHFAENLSLVPPKLFEYLTFLLPLPVPVELHPATVALCTLAVAGVIAWLVRIAPSLAGPERTLLFVGGGFALALGAFYGLYFGAGHFMSRYLFAASPATALLVGAVAAGAARALADRGLAALPALGAAAAVLLAVGLDARLYARGDRHPHFQVVRWVEAHVAEEQWVGAIQTGTLGFFHDRTVNLDGKVNPEALEARKGGGVSSYVAARELPYLVDWVGIAEWADRPGFAPHYELLVRDERRNLAVLRRRDAPAAAPGVSEGPAAGVRPAAATAPRS